jgi:hypothetical protein
MHAFHSYRINVTLSPQEQPPQRSRSGSSGSRIPSLMKGYRFFIFFLLLLLCPLFVGASAGEPGGTLRFTVISDSHLMNKGGIYSLYPATGDIVKAIIRDRPDFVVHCGDMISINAESNSRVMIGHMWTLFNRGVRDRIVESGIPFFPSPGNHDVYGEGRALYERQWRDYKVPGIDLESGSYSRYYSFHRGKNLFIFLDGSGISISGEQMCWLKNQLKENGTCQTFVFSHVGLMGRGRHPGDTIRGELEGQIRSRGNIYFITGHQHLVSIDRLGAATHIISGSAGETPPFNYLRFKIQGREVSWEIRKGSD